MTLIPDLQRDLVDAAGRVGRPRLRAPAVLAAVMATAALVVAAVVLVSGDEGDPGAPASDSVMPGLPPADPPASPPEDPPTDAPPTEPPRPRMEPLPGSESPPIEFEFDGVSYSATGFRSEGSVICILVERATGDAEAVPNSGACLRDRILSDALKERHVHMFAGGGGWPAQADGFARAEVTELSLVGPDAADGLVVLSEPWRPEPWEGDPIRFVYVLSDGPAGRPSFDNHRFQATLANGEVVPAP